MEVLFGRKEFLMKRITFFQAITLVLQKQDLFLSLEH